VVYVDHEADIRVRVVLHERIEFPLDGVEVLARPFYLGSAPVEGVRGAS
jgi:hypothetical protein